MKTVTTFNPAVLPPIEHAAARHFEYYGSTLTTNTALKVALLTFSMVSFFVTSMAQVVLEIPRAAFDHMRVLGAGEGRIDGGERQRPRQSLLFLRGWRHRR